MNIIVCKPNKPPSLHSITGKYEELSGLIQGQIKALSTNNPNIVIICSKELRENGINYGRMNITGTFIFVAHDKGHLRSLTNEEINEIIHTIRIEDFTLI